MFARSFTKICSKIIPSVTDELLAGHVGELIDSHLVGLGGVRVVAFDFEEVLGEDLEPVEFFFRGVVSVEVVLELPELLAEGVAAGGELGDQEGGDYCQANDNVFSLHVGIIIINKSKYGLINHTSSRPIFFMVLSISANVICSSSMR